MFNTKKIKTSLILLTAALLVGCNTIHDFEYSNIPADEDKVAVKKFAATTNVESKILDYITAKYPNVFFKIDPIMLDAENVFLIGITDSIELRKTISEKLYGVYGIKKVYNNIKIGKKYPLGVANTDKFITMRVKNTIAVNFSSYLFDIKVRTIGGLVYLMHMEDTPITSTDKKKIYELVGKIGGVKAVYFYIKNEDKKVQDADPNSKQNSKKNSK